MPASKTHRNHGDRDCIVLFNHIPRTGGGALLHALESVTHVVSDYPPEDDASLECWRNTPYRLDELPGGTIIAGHFTAGGARLVERYPCVLDASRYRLVTFLRSPRPWCESHLRYFGVDSTRRAIDAGRAYRGVFARVLDVSTDDVERALDAYWFVGLSESLVRDARVLFDALGLPDCALTGRNRSSPRPLDTQEQRLVSAYVAQATADARLYAAASRRASRISGTRGDA